jgi:hypothetical protein
MYSKRRDPKHQNYLVINFNTRSQKIKQNINIELITSSRPNNVHVKGSVPGCFQGRHWHYAGFFLLKPPALMKGCLLKMQLHKIMFKPCA